MNLLKLTNHIRLGSVLFLTLLNFQISSVKAGAIFQRPTVDTLAIQDFDRFIGRKAVRLLDELKNERIEKYYIEEPPGQLIGMYIDVKDKALVFKVYFKKLQHVEKENLKVNWPWDKVILERISSIELYRDGVLIKESGKK